MNDEPILSSADVAELLGEPEPTVRRWHHAGLLLFFGQKDGHLVFYSARDAAGFAVARDLIRVGFPPILAGRVGATVTCRDPEKGAVLEGTPQQIAQIAPPPETGIHLDRTSWRVPAKSRARVSVPVGAIFAEITHRAQRLRSRAA